MVKYVNQLPPQVQAEIKRDAYRINCEWFGCDKSEDEEMERIIEECVMCSKVRDILGTEDEGLLSYEKYARFA